MYRGGGLDRFKKAESTEPFSVINPNPTNTPPTPKTPINNPIPNGSNASQIGGGKSTWQPPDWAIEPRSGVYYLDVLKDGEVIDRINLDKKRHLFGRQQPMCDFVLDHQSVSRQHAAVVPHKNGSIYVIDLGSVHGTFVANERLAKESPVELEVGQSLKFAASTRSYVLRKDNSAFLQLNPKPAEINLPSPPDPDDLDSVVAYNTILNRYGISSDSSDQTDSNSSERPKKMRKVSFRDQMGGELIQVVGISDGSGIGPGPGPIGVKEGGLVGKYESLVQVTVIPKGQETKEQGINSPKGGGVTEKLKQAMNKVKNGGGGIYDGIYGEVGTSSWALKSDGQDDASEKIGGEGESSKSLVDETDDLFGD